MTWISLCLIAGLLFAVSNYFDKYLLSKVIPDTSAGTLSILGGLTSAPYIAVLGVWSHRQVGSQSPGNILGALVAGVLLTIGFYAYFRALAIADASIVATLFQLVVAFNLVSAWLILHERLNALELVAMALIVFGSIILNLELRDRKAHFNRPVFWWMVVASLLVAAANIVFKISARDMGFLPTQFFAYAGSLLVGLTIFIASRSARRNFLAIWHTSGRTNMLGLSSLNELVSLGGVMAANYALLLAPVALVQAVLGVQVIYLFILGFLLTRLFPRIVRENITKSHLILKYASAFILLFGISLLAFA